MFVAIVSSFASALAPLYEVYIALQGLLAVMLYGIYLGCFVLGEGERRKRDI